MNAQSRLCTPKSVQSRLEQLSEREVVDKLLQVCMRYQIKRLSVFGSVLGDSFSDKSDVDILVEFEVGNQIGLLGQAAAELELSELLQRHVDLRTPDELSRYFRERVIDEAELLYAA